MSEPITPRDVLQSVASAIPQDLRGDIIIVSSLAATYQLLRDHVQTMRVVGSITVPVEAIGT